MTYSNSISFLKWELIFEIPCNTLYTDMLNPIMSGDFCD